MRKAVVYLLFLLLLAPSVLRADEFYESRLNSGLRNSDVASYQLLQQARTDRVQAPGLMNRAIMYSPDLPAVYFEQASEKLSLSYAGVLDSVDFIVSGVNAYSRNFWWGFSLVGSAFLSLVLSFVAAILLIVIIRLVTDLPLLAHEIAESGRNIALLVILFILSLISPLLLLAGTLLLLGLYMGRLDRVVVYLFLVFLMASPFVFRAASLFLGVSSSGTMRAIVDVNESRDNTYALAALKSQDDPVALFSRALALKRTGNYDEARTAFENLIRTRPDARAYVNLGNVHVSSGSLDDAIKNYLAAVNLQPLASAYYDLSQASRERLDFEKGNEYFNKALETDRNAVSAFRAVYDRTPNRIVADETLPQPALWNYAWAFPVRTSTFNLSMLPGWMISVSALLLILASYMMNLHSKNKAYRCRRCNSIFCPRCEKHIMWGGMCPDCFRSLIKLDETEVKQRVARLMSIYEHQKKRRDIMKVMSFVLPGAPQVYGGRVLYGLLLLWPFLFFVMLPVTTAFMRPDAQGRHWLVNVISAMTAAILLVLSNIITRHRISKGWL